MRFELKIFYVLLMPLLGWVVGCQAPGIYYWGHYESVVYDMYANPGKSSPEALAARLEEDLHRAASLNKPLPPGFHAQLGYLYALSGKTDLAQQEYDKEKGQFPESAVFMDRLSGSPTKK